jgi:two-component system heavy metal sensor histidine kinase CusS
VETPDGKRDNVSIAVINRGAEIDPIHLPRLFDRFYRADASRAHANLNHGLGLAIVAAIARMHGGTTFAISSSGITKIGISLPESPIASPDTFKSPS